MKVIKFNKCKSCPFIMQITQKSFCTKYGQEILDADKFPDFCKLDDYPKTVKEFLKGTI